MSSPASYLCLNTQVFTSGGYTLLPIRLEDREAIRSWRNEQLEILRQNKPLSREEQDNYFKTTVASLFDKQEPNQLLFSFLKDNELIGYGGLVHMNWIDKNAEISFLLETTRNSDKTIFQKEWGIYLSLIKRVAFDQLNFKKIYTYGYDIRPHLTDVILSQGFIEEARLNQHVKKGEQYYDVLIHSFFSEQYQ